MGSIPMDPFETLKGGFVVSSSKKPEPDCGGFTVSSSRAPVKIDNIVAAKLAATHLKR
jgi:hypothetical protein